MTRTKSAHNLTKEGTVITCIMLKYGSLFHWMIEGLYYFSSDFDLNLHQNV